MSYRQGLTRRPDLAHQYAQTCQSVLQTQAEQGNVYAQHALARMAADQGLALAQRLLGIVYY